VRSSSVGRRYAKALLALADEQKQTARVEKELVDFAETWGASAELRAVFENPKVDEASRKKVLTAVLDRMAASPLVKNGLALLAERGRLKHLPEIAQAFATLASGRTGTVTAEVTSATALPEAYFAELKSALEKATGKKVVLVKKQDPSLIAGVVTRVGDRVIDGSVRARLSELQEELLAH
jgi:F-type H+-transporting ATPase subunit delta